MSCPDARGPSAADVRAHAASLVELRHALRTPLNHIIGYSEMLMEEAGEGTPASLVADLQRIHTAGKQLQRVISGLLDPPAPDPGDQRDAPASRAASEPPSVAGLDEPAARADHHAASDAGGGRLLVIDDNEGNRDMLSRRLRREGYRVATAASGPDGLKLLESESIDLVLLDVLMPGMNGYDVLTALKAQERWQDIPVIMVSALGEIRSVVRCIEQGAEDYLTKPFDPILLRARIGACLEKKRLRDQEVRYLNDVARVTAAAAAVEAGVFEADSLAEVTGRSDELGRLARVFQRMALEIQAREQLLKRKIRELRIEIDEAKKAKQVAEITETAYFEQLQKRARELKGRAGRSD